jgi:hypothetical protein
MFNPDGFKINLIGLQFFSSEPSPIFHTLLTLKVQPIGREESDDNDEKARLDIINPW